MHRLVLGISLCALTVVHLAPLVAEAKPTIVVGNHLTNDFGVASVPFDIFVTGVGPGVDSIASIDLFISIASGQVVAPPWEPKIVDIDVVTGTIFSGNSANAAPGAVLFQSDQIWEIDNVTADTAPITQSGKIATVYVSTVGSAVGIFPFRFLHSTFEGSPLGSTFSNSLLLAEPFAGSDGTIFIDPEPSSALIAGLGLLALVLTIQRRRR